MRYKRVLLVAPRFYKGRFRLSIHPLAGLGYIDEALHNNGFVVSVFDMNLQYNYRDLERKIYDFKPDIIGFTVMTFGHRDLYALIDKVKKAYPEVKIVAGGPHISILRKEALEDCPGIDYGIVLEGDSKIVQLCRGDKLCEIEGFIYREDGNVIINNSNNFIADLDKLSFPRYRSFEMDKYPLGQIGIVTSRGCPYDCIYCPVTSAIGKLFRYRSAQSIIDEVEYWYNNGYRDILIVDDNFTLSGRRVEQICDLLIKKDFKGLSLKCPNGIRADRVDYSLLKFMRKAGFDLIAFGVEAAEDRILKNIKKGEGIEIIERNIANACRLGFEVDLFFLIGSPGETLGDVKKSFCLARRYPVRTAKFYNLVPFPTTELFEWIKENNYFLRSQEYIMNNSSHFINEPCFFTPQMSAKDRVIAFRMGQRVSRAVRRRFIERKLYIPLLLRKVLSWAYTISFVDLAITNNALFLRLKERIKRLLLK